MPKGNKGSGRSHRDSEKEEDRRIGVKLMGNAENLLVILDRELASLYLKETMFPRANPEMGTAFFVKRGERSYVISDPPH